MIPAPFDYIRPASVDEAVQALGADPDARILAGGQTLVPMLAMRLARPSALIDVTRLEDLAGIGVEGDRLVVRACTRQAVALKSDLIAREVPLLAAALPHVGHPPTRARGTVGGSVAHGDPSAEISLAATILDAAIVFLTEDGEEVVQPEEFFIGPTVTMAPMGGLLVRIEFPRRPDGRVGAGFAEIASRRSDYAFASAGAQVILGEDGTCAEALLGIGSVGDVPVKVDVSALAGTRLTKEDLKGAAEAACEDLDCVDDLHATATYRRRAAVRLAVQALEQAKAQAEGEAA